MSTDLTPTAAADGGHLVSFIDDKEFFVGCCCLS
jgi:hypothetical protein